MVAAAESFGRVRAWSTRSSTVSYAVMLLGLLAVWPSVAFLVHYWLEISDYHYGFLIVLASVTWLIALRSKLDAAPVQPEPAAALPLAMAIATWLIVFEGNSAFAQQMLIPAILWLAVLASAGRRAARLTTGALAYLYFAVPLWDYLDPILQRVTVFVTETGLALAGIPAIVNEFTVTLPEGTFQIAEGCSGKRYFMVALAVACLASVVLRLRRGVVLVCAAAALALVANWLRVFIVIYAGHATHMRHYFVSVEHFSLGWVIFALLLLVVAALAGRLSHSTAERVDVPGDEVPVRAKTMNPVLAWLPFGLLAVPFAYTAAGEGAITHSPSLGSLPVMADTWAGPLPADEDWWPQFTGNSDDVRAAYRSRGGAVEIYLGVYGEQTPGRELIYYRNSVLSPGDWQSASGFGVRHLIATAFGHQPVELRATTKTEEHWIVTYLYDIGGVKTANPLLAQLYYGAMALTGGRPAGVIAFAARCGEDCDEARRLIAGFRKERGPLLLALIPDHYVDDLAPRESPRKHQ